MRPLTPDDIYRLRLVTDVQLAPDGERVAFVVRISDPALDRDRSEVWLARSDGTEAGPLTSGPWQDGLPRWSPDGRRLSFTSDRGGPRNLFLLDLSTGTGPLQLTRFADDVSHEMVYPVATSIAWSPDGTSICCVVKDAKPAGTEGPVAYAYESLRYKSAEEGWFDGRRRHLWIVPVDGGPPRQLTTGDGNDSQPTWWPDGRSIGFVSDRAIPDVRGYATKGIWRVMVDSTGAPCFLTAVHGSVSPAPSISPDGRHIAYYGHDDPLAGYAKNLHLWIRPADGGTAPWDLLAGWDYEVGSIVMSDTHALLAPQPPAWSADGTTLLFQATVRGAANIYEAAIESGPPRAVTKGDHEVVTLSFDRHGHRFAAAIATAERTADVHLGDRDGRLERITDLNRELWNEVATGTPDVVTVSVPNGLPVECWIFKPPDYRPDRRYPLILHILPGVHFAHGYSFNFEFHLLASHGYLVLLVNPRGAGSYGEGFKRAIGPFSWAAPTELDDLMAAVDEVIQRGWADSSRLGVTGDAHGGSMTNWIIGQTRRFRAAAARRSAVNCISFFGTSDRGGAGGTMMWHAFGGADPYGHPDRYVERSPLTHVHRIETPLLLIASEGDLREPVTQSEELYVALRYLGKPARLVVYPTRTHFLSRAGTPRQRASFFGEILEWFDRHLVRTDRVDEAPA